jgi:molybdopterin/thiamine biosynthesis adenylyltransferase
VRREQARALIIGVGGLGCPAALALAHAGIGILGLCDDDVVDRTNLHRQILFSDTDVGTPKLDAAARALKAIASELASGLQVRLHPARLLPENAVALVREYDVVLEGSDNFATKFLAADACSIAAVPVVHASAIRWIGTALAVGARGRPCYRCLFEDLPHEDTPNCAEAGVIGPVAGVVAAAQVDLALAMLDGSTPPVEGQLVTFDGKADRLRRRTIERRGGCALCGSAASIRHIEPEAYVGPACAG